MEHVPFPERQWVSIVQACEISGEGRTKIYEHLKAAKIESKKQGRRRLISVPSLMRHCAASKENIP
jgi:predicted Zn-ribbon and HTH transcriptional regulator